MASAGLRAQLPEPVEGPTGDLEKVLSNEEYSRYARHLTLDQVGVAGQRRLLDARVLCIGAGGLGSPVLLYLAAAGVGTLGIVDADRVDLSNLQRQVVHSTRTVGVEKTRSAQQRLAELNPQVRVVTHETQLTSANAMEIMAGYDLLIDGTDNFATRYLTNDACVLTGKPNIYGSVYGFEGQASVFWPGGPTSGPCYRCLFPEPPPPGAVPSCAEGGVLGVLPGLIGLIQATEAVKIILQKGDTLAGRLLLYDAMAMSFRTVKVKRNAECPLCGDNPTIKGLIDYEQFCNASRGETAPLTTITHDHQGRKLNLRETTVDELRSRINSGENLFILDVRNPDEHARGAIPGAQLVPLPELPTRLAELEPHKKREIIIHCQKGGRSARACGVLANAGFEDLVNVKGGYEAWQATEK